jgi:CRISPR system Cascade subunit CasA
MNLISEPWIPVRRADGSRDKIAPCQTTDHVGTDKSPIVAIASPRPDFDGALAQFLIGLLQTTCTPPNKGIWRQWRREPPSAEELKSRFSDVSFAFELEGERAFMQDFTPSELTNELDIAALLIEAPGDQTLEQNKDHFIKRDLVERLCPQCVAMALLTLQINAPSGGRGYRCSPHTRG